LVNVKRRLLCSLEEPRYPIWDLGPDLTGAEKLILTEVRILEYQPLASRYTDTATKGDKWYCGNYLLIELT
jgi:hypothetical protein